MGQQDSPKSCRHTAVAPVHCSNFSLIDQKPPYTLFCLHANACMRSSCQSQDNLHRCGSYNHRLEHSNGHSSSAAFMRVFRRSIGTKPRGRVKFRKASISGPSSANWCRCETAPCRSKIGSLVQQRGPGELIAASRQAMLSPTIESPPRRKLISHRQSDLSSLQGHVTAAKVTVDCR